MIVVDTNVLLSYLLREGITRRIITRNPRRFTTPVHCIAELWEHRGRWNIGRHPDSEAREVLADMERFFIRVEPEEAYRSALGEAGRLTPDPGDAPVVALALSVDCEGIWTYNTRHFRDPRLLERVRVLTTREVVEIYPAK